MVRVSSSSYVCKNSAMYSFERRNCISVAEGSSAANGIESSSQRPEVGLKIEDRRQMVLILVNPCDCPFEAIEVDDAFDDSLLHC